MHARGAPLLPGSITPTGAKVSHSSNEPAALWSPARAVDHDRVTERRCYEGKKKKKRQSNASQGFFKNVTDFYCAVVGLTTGPLWLHPGMMMMSWFQCLLTVNIISVGTMPSAPAFNLNFESR